MNIPRFSGKVAICTASTAGIGYATAERIAREGAKVVICSRRQENVDAALKKLRDQDLEVSGIVCHQAKKEDRQKLIEFTLATYGGIDLLFASAGVNPVKVPVLSITESLWDKLFDVNVKSTFMIIRECVPYMIERGGGAIVTNSTFRALFPDVDAPIVGPYGVSKSTLLSLTKVLAQPLAKHNIRINCITPGPIETPFLRGAIRRSYPSGELKPRTFFRRFGKPDECGAVVAFLLSDDASFITGEIITVGGGSEYYKGRF